MRCDYIIYWHCRSTVFWQDAISRADNMESMMTWTWSHTTAAWVKVGKPPSWTQAWSAVRGGGRQPRRRAQSLDGRGAEAEYARTHGRAHAGSVTRVSKTGHGRIKQRGVEVRRRGRSGRRKRQEVTPNVLARRRAGETTREITLTAQGPVE